MKRILIIATLALLGSCHPDKNKPVDLDELKFNTTDASELFFKNVRQSDYVLEENKKAGMNTYHCTDLADGNLQLEPFIIINWRNDQAFIFFETKSTELIDFIIADEHYSFDPSFQKNHAELAIHIYNAILSNQQVYFIAANNQQKEFFQTADQKNIYRKVIFDFLRLVELR